MFTKDKDSEIFLRTPKKITKKTSAWRRFKNTPRPKFVEEKPKKNTANEDNLREAGKPARAHFSGSKLHSHAIREAKVLKADLMERLVIEIPVFDDPLQVSRLKGHKDKLNLLFEDGFPLNAVSVAKQLYYDTQEVEKLRIKNQLLGVRVGQQEYFYPRFQLTGSKILPGLKEVLTALRDYSPWTQLMFLKTGDIRLEGKTPLEILQKGDIEKVVAAAKCYGVHGAA